MNEYLTRKSEQLALLLTDPKVRRAFRSTLRKAKELAREAGNVQKAGLLSDEDADSYLGVIAMMCEEALEPLGIDVSYEGEIFLEAITDEFIATATAVVLGSRQTVKWVTH